MASFRAASFALVVASYAAVASAQTELGPVDELAFPPPLAPSDFSALESSRPLDSGHLTLGFRLTYLGRPLALTLPSPSPDGTRASVVEHALLGDLAFAYGFRGFDLGLGAGVRAFGDGSGTSAVTGGPGLEPFALHDPRVALGFSTSIDRLRIRPYGVLFVPVGDANGFASEGFARGELGASFGLDLGPLVLGFDAAARLRKTREFGLAVIGPALRLGFGALYRVTDDWSAGAEIVLLPGFSAQLAPPNGAPGTLFPAEARLTTRYRFGTWSLLASGGTGLPLGRASSLDVDRSLQRSPTSPLVVLLLEARHTF